MHEHLISYRFTKAINRAKALYFIYTHVRQLTNSKLKLIMRRTIEGHKIVVIYLLGNTDQRANKSAH